MARNAQPDFPPLVGFPHPRGDGPCRLNQFGIDAVISPPAWGWPAVQDQIAALPAGADWGAVKEDITASLKPLETGSNFDPEQTNDLLWRVLAREGMIDYGPTPMKPLLDKPLREALSARPPTAAEAKEDAIFMSYPSSAYRDFLDGKAEYPGMSSLLTTLRQLSIEEGEPQP